MKPQSKSLRSFNDFKTKSQSENLRSNSAASSRAPTSTLCVPDIQLESLNQRIDTCIESLLARSKQLHAVAYLLHVSGCRVSEILGIRSFDVSNSGMIKIRGAKGSSDRLINAGLVKSFLLGCKSNSVHPFANLNRFYVYREFKKVGLQYQFIGSSKNSVTHIFRHASNLNAKSLDTDILVRSQHLGHKSTKSTQHYEHF